MIKFNKCKLNPEILDQWILADVNVLLVGEKGVGKSLQVIDSFKRNNLKFAYFSGATLDPWIHDA
jgi:predicted GTPase